MRRGYAYSIVLALTMGSAALFYLAASDDRDNKVLTDLLHQAAFDSISERLVAMGLPRDGLQQVHQARLGQTDIFGYTPVAFLYVSGAQCIAFQAECKNSNDVAYCAELTWYPYHEHQEDCPLSPDFK